MSIATACYNVPPVCYVEERAEEEGKRNQRYSSQLCLYCCMCPLNAELVKQFEITKKNLEKAQTTLTTTETELKEIKKVRPAKTLNNWLSL